MNSDDIREAFLNYFKGKQHKIIPSSSLVPHDDPTLLLTTAGMVQIKPYFLGFSVPANPRLVSCQKCFRTTDIDLVGDTKHLTFFEMLGNFSVGDYFKREAIFWAWEFVTQCLMLPSDRLWITIYLDDDDAFDCWREMGIPEDRILRFGDKENFWGPAGNTGPCGPCSEIHYDFGEDVGCRKSNCGPDCSCSRFSEIWNLVFTQYNQDSHGNHTSLPRPNIDTGMGLERVAAVIKGMPSVYETDLFSPLLEKIASITKSTYGINENNANAVRIIAEHSRGITFLVADGVLPSNEGRGYIMRRLLRKASFYGRKIGIAKPFLNEISEIVVIKMGHIYPELVTNRNLIMEIVKAEEERFIATLDTGINLVEEVISESLKRKRNYLDGKEVFQLYDTYGFPPELTAEIAGEKNLSIDFDGFVVEMEKQKEKARASQKFKTSVGMAANSGVAVNSRLILPSTDFIGYDKLKTQSQVVSLFEPDSYQPLSVAANGQKVAMILEKTTFYAEIGGQTGDAGKITTDSSRVDIINTVWSPFGRLADGLIVHLGSVVSGSISIGDIVEVEVDKDCRDDVARNHTATHLLQTALRQILGVHVFQRGSLVSPGRLRFDFSHMRTLDQQELDGIQHIVNAYIRQNLQVEYSEISYENAKKSIDKGELLAIFGEKYGDIVRALRIGNPPISAELCGGTHVNSTGEIGLFLIINESSIGAGLHRIEAITGRGAESYITERIGILNTISEKMKSSPLTVQRKIEALITDLALERKQSESLERKLSLNKVEDLLAHSEYVNGITIIAANISSSMNIMREMGDTLRARLKSAVIVLGTIQNDKPGFISIVTPDLVEKGIHAGELVKKVAGITGGSGGGKAEMAQAGGKDINKIEEALGLVKNFVKEAL